MHMGAKHNKIIENGTRAKLPNKVKFYYPIVLLPKGIYLVFHALWT